LFASYSVWSRSRAARFRAVQFRTARFSAGGGGGGAETCGAEVSNACNETDLLILFFTSSYS